MKFDWLKFLGAIGKAVIILIFGGIALFFVFLLGSLGAFPLYVTRVIPVAGIALLLALLLSVIGYLPQRWIRRVWLVLLCVFLGAAAYVGWGAYNDNIPTVDDRTLVLRDYRPFTEDNKLMTLEEPASFRLESPWDIELDGATALYPIYAAFVQEVYPEQYEYSPYDSDGPVQCTGTIDAYTRLLNYETDIIFAARPSQAQLAAAEKAGKQLHFTPIGREAFVFFVNSKNPVTGLTVEQIQGIYTGEITNWKDVGGKNQKIRPFQRAEDSGSQTALQALMAGLPLMEPEEEDRVAGMGGIITEVASYRNYKNAIGFSFRYYATEMVRNGDIRLLALNCVEPTKETIRDGTYPIASEFYAVTCSPSGEPAPQETDPKLAAFLDWILSEQGQEIVEKTGYVSVR